jgi:hypothetical protein
VPTGPSFDAMRKGEFDVVLEGNCNNVPNPVLDVQKYLPRASDERHLLRTSPASSLVVTQISFRCD